MAESAAVTHPERASASYGREFRLYATGQAVSVVGDRIAGIALVFLVIHLTGSYAPALAAFYIARVAPTLLGGLVAGVIVDHFDRRRLMIGADLGRAVLLVAVPALSSLQLWTLYPMVVVLYALTLVFDTASRAALPDVVREESMLGANAILSSIERAADIAYALGGALIYVFQFQAPFYIDAGTFLFSAAMVSAMRIPAGTRIPLPRLREVFGRIRPGFAFLMEHPFLRWSTLAFTIAPLAGGAAYVLAPLYANHVLGQSTGLVGPLRSGAFRFSVLEVSLGVGALCGAVVAARLARRWPRGRIFALGMTASGLSDALLGLTGNMYAAVIIMALSGLFHTLFVISGMTLLQTLTPSEMRGRVIAARLTVINSALAVGSALGGVLLLSLSYSAFWLIEGGVIASASLFVWLPAKVRGQP